MSKYLKSFLLLVTILCTTLSLRGNLDDTLDLSGVKCRLKSGLANMATLAAMHQGLLSENDIASINHFTYSTIYSSHRPPTQSTSPQRLPKKDELSDICTQLNRCKNLETFATYMTFKDDSVLQMLSANPSSGIFEKIFNNLPASVKTLDIGDLPSSGEEPFHLSEELLDSISRIRSLKEIHLNFVNISDFERLTSSAPLLDSLSLGSLNSVANETCKTVVGKQIKKLRLRNIFNREHHEHRRTGCVSKELLSLLSSPGLTYIDLSYNDLFTFNFYPNDFTIEQAEKQLRRIINSMASSVSTINLQYNFKDRCNKNSHNSDSLLYTGNAQVHEKLLTVLEEASFFEELTTPGIWHRNF